MRMTKPIFNKLVNRYEEEFDLNPLQKTRQRNVLVPRQTLFYILNTKFHIHYQTLSEWTGWDRTVMYHSCQMVEDMLGLNEAQYVDEINKWALVFKAMDGYINIVSPKVDKSVSAEATITRILENFDTETAKEILYNVLSMLRND